MKFKSGVDDTPSRPSRECEIGTHRIARLVSVSKTLNQLEAVMRELSCRGSQRVPRSTRFLQANGVDVVQLNQINDCVKSRLER